MACRYPDANSPAELWENVLAQRRAFRRIPPERLRLEDYFSTDRHAPDSLYSAEAAVIEGYEFDRVRFRVAGSTFRSADLAHWLSLDVASQALDDAGFIDGEGLPRETTGVFVGNTLTGEFSRAGVMRLRWPYVRRVVEAALVKENWTPARRTALLQTIESSYKEPFPPISEESLAGGLSNTIAGRICNYFDLKGGGYTLDGACASSLLAVINACAALLDGELDVALAGGIDLSLDPFELVGFAKAGALASERMRIYDLHSEGFWPGEGCGFVLLMRHTDAVAQRRRIYAVIRGWGVSSDGSGGITRPEEEGQLLALERAYRRAQFGVETVTYFEGHGTGTSVGDATELRALSRARREGLSRAGSDVERHVAPAAIGSVKANIGHTKAAAGITGLIKASMALNRQIIPPTTGCETPHPELNRAPHALRILNEGELWLERPLRAGVSAMGFGGINTHVVLEGDAATRRRALIERERALLSSAWDTHLLLFGARDAAELQRQVERLLRYAHKLSMAEVGDVAAALERSLDDSAQEVRAAIVASTPAELASRLKALRVLLLDGVTSSFDTDAGVFKGGRVARPRIGFLFPGQGSPTHVDGGMWRRSFAFVRDLYEGAANVVGRKSHSTEVAQPAIAASSVAGLRMLSRLGVEADVAVGHSLGELVALHWAGALSEEELLRMARVRGQAMASLDGATGAMASIGADWQSVKELMNGDGAVIAGFNSPTQTVISGAAAAVSTVLARARERGLKVVSLPVSHAFHSPLIAAAAPVFAQHLARVDFQPLQRLVISTVNGASLRPDADLRTLLYQQITGPVRFIDAVNAASEGGVDLWIEVGPGQVLRGLLQEFAAAPVLSVDAGGASLNGLLQAVGALFVAGARVDHHELWTHRLAKPFDLDWQPKFFVNPCELAPLPETHEEQTDDAVLQPTGWLQDDDEAGESRPQPVAARETNHASASTPLEFLRQLIAARAELPLAAVKDEHRLLSDLHLNSITVSQLVDEAARHIGVSASIAPTEYTDAMLSEVAQALAELALTGQSASLPSQEQVPSGVDSWVRAFTIELLERPLTLMPGPTSESGEWRVIAPDDYPLRMSLSDALNTGVAGKGVVVCLPSEPDESHLGLLLEAAHTALAERDTTHFVLVQHGGGGGGFTRSLYLEATGINTCVVDVPLDHPQATAWVLAEASAVSGYSEAHYDDAGRRREPVLQALPHSASSIDEPLGAEDVLLVTGGGKGIAAECAFSLSQKTGARLALLGRSRPESDAALSTNLERLRAAGINFRYISADITDEEAVRRAIREVEETFGFVTAIMHGAGTNTPQLLTTLDESMAQHTLLPKVQGLRHVLAAIKPERLGTLITFGSIIARTGMRGEADYALANEWLTRLTERWQTEHPCCRCLSVEWSIWSGVGMGERLGRVDALLREGITPIPPEEGVAMLNDLLSRPLPATAVIVASRFGMPPTLRMKGTELPFLRFLEQPKVYYPGIELVADAGVSMDTDPYLDDHVFQNERLLPAVIGLEAMAQAAAALLEIDEPPVLEEVHFNRPILVPPHEPLMLRVAALKRQAGQVEVVLRSERTAFQVNHFQAKCSVGPPTHVTDSELTCDVVEEGHNAVGTESACVALDPARELYGGLLFQSGRFRRLRGYHYLRATECVAEIAPAEATEWFGRYLPDRLLLGDPAARDAAIHAIQACIPHATLLPSGIDRCVLVAAQASGPRFMHAREVAREGDTFVYNIEITGAGREVRERWEGLRLRRVSQAKWRGAWPEPLLGPYLERKVSDLIPGSKVSITVERNGAARKRHECSDQAIQTALGRHSAVLRRPDGKPTVACGCAVSAAHTGDLTLGVAGPGPLGCDLELVVKRPASMWQDLLGVERFRLADIMAQEADEDWQIAATRAWAAAECLKKAGAAGNVPVMLTRSCQDGWVLLSAGQLSIATLAESVRGVNEPLVLAVLARRQEENGGASDARL
jgi:enediyne polyketide synthase